VLHVGCPSPFFSTVYIYMLSYSIQMLHDDECYIPLNISQCEVAVWVLMFRLSSIRSTRSKSL